MGLEHRSCKVPGEGSLVHPAEPSFYFVDTQLGQGMR